MDEFDICVVGAGVIGLAVARQLLLDRRTRNSSLLIMESEPDIGYGISSRNSEVIHAGIYYRPDSLKSRLCVRGKELLYEYCRQQSIPHRRLGKLIVAQDGEEPALHSLWRRAINNGVTDLLPLNRQQLRRQAPYLSGAAALLSPSSGIIDSHALMHSLLAEAQLLGALYVANTSTVSLEYESDSIKVTTADRCETRPQVYSFRCRRFINCAGLKAQAVAASIQGLEGLEIPRLHLCKGDYFSYSGKHPFTRLVYPLPETDVRGLGIHATLDMGGQLRFGPDTEYVDEENFTIDSHKAAQFAAAIARYFPDIDSERLLPDYAGIRPKLVGPGQAQSDFEVQFYPELGQANLIQLFGIESPGLTASLALAEHVTEGLAKLD